MKERFEQMTLDQLYAIRETMCYLYPPMEGIEDETANQLWYDLEDVLFRKLDEYYNSDEYRAKCARAQEDLKALFKYA